MPHIYDRKLDLKKLVSALAISSAMAAGSVQAQVTIEVGGAGAIGQDTLTTDAGVASVPDSGDTWSANGGGGAPVNSKLISPAFTVPSDGNVTLTFTHRYAFEVDYDGGAVFVSVNGGPASQIPAGDFTSNGYTGKTVNSAAWGGGEDVFIGVSPGFNTPALIQSVADLGELTAGDEVSVEFRGEWDQAVLEAAPGWEIGTVKLTDALAADFVDIDFNPDGPSGFTVVNSDPLAGPWEYSLPTFRFEINADTQAADSYAPDIQGSVIDISNAVIVVDRLAGTLDGGEVFTLFDLTGGTTLTGSIGSLTLLPIGLWDTSNLETNGTITYVSPPSILTWNADSGSGDWDTITSNWLDAATPTTFTDDGSNIAVFDDTPAVGGTVTVTQGMSPARTLVDTTGTYKLVSGVSGTGVANSIDSGDLIKNGTGTLQLGDDDLSQQFSDPPNIYSNGFTSATINAGTVKYNSLGAFGTGPVTIAGGVTLIQARVEGRIFTGNEDLKNDVILSGGLVNTPLAFGNENKGIWFAGTVSGPGGFNVTGTARYLGFTGNNTFSGGITMTNTADNNPGTVDFGTSYTALGTGTLNISDEKIRNTSPRGSLQCRSDLPGNDENPTGVMNPIVIATGKYAHLNCPNNNHTVQWGGVISGDGIFRKWGRNSNTSTVILSGTNTYTGGTDVDAGTLLINGDSSAATGPVNVGADTGSFPSTGSTLGGTGTIGGTITVGAVGKIAPGTSTGTFTTLGDASLTAGGTIEIEIDDSQSQKSDIFAVTGELDLTGGTLDLVVTGEPTEPVYVIATYGTRIGNFATVNNLPLGYVVDYQYAGGTAIAILESNQTLYQMWAGGFGGLGVSDPETDFDLGGLDTGIEWVVGGDPSDPSDDSTVAPVTDDTTDPTFHLFTYRRSDVANADANTVISVEYGSDLDGWTTAVDNFNTVLISENNDVEPGIDEVEVAIDRSLAVDGRLFVRLKVVVTVPAG